DYVSFDIIPSSEDTATILNNLTRLKEDFATTDNAETFVNTNSEDQFNDIFVTKKSFMSAYSDSIMNLQEGAVFGPYFENGAYKLVKVLEKRSLPDSAKAQHILIALNQ